ncbi:nuclear transport factor 2 family protein [Nocardioides immobilis]|uniref:Nuclear transport factor 2 family protein n=1 Tax=Nocardioides immobilis TaxID=2049295 RepID=A0A417XV67_9ACTN|nr:nuclear transport factor 2 family protein [Nocardioides immobilis]RHW24067.1 nuclear transport factor 2 family protein [Nocardioides immobilis]
MKREDYDEYIRRFNAQDPTAFDEYIADDLHMQNGLLEFDGRQGMRDHYARIWSSFSEDLTVERFVSDEQTAAVQMWAHFTALRDDPESLFGPVRKGHTFDFRGLIRYDLRDGQFTDIRVAYNSFISTDHEGVVTELGIPH